MQKNGANHINTNYKKEIGGEFWTKEYKELGDSAICSPNKRFLLSGRTALDFIIKDIKIGRNLKTALMPEYCCDSMIRPFLDNDVKVWFYPFQDKLDKNIILSLQNTEAVLLIDHFGYKISQNAIIANAAQSLGKIVIYDATHNIKGPDYPVDYTFCSYRKWLYCNTAIAYKADVFNLPQPKKKHERYIQKRKKASELKSKYMNGEQIQKTSFLECFSEAEELLENDYTGYSGDFIDFDVKSIVESRRKNAKYLIEQLRDLNDVRLWNSNIGEKDIPLCVPILSNYRDELKKYLIKNNIYCPIHWPVTKWHKSNTVFFLKELSLICDQRYSECDMQREADIIKIFFNREGKR